MPLTLAQLVERLAPLSPDPAKLRRQIRAWIPLRRGQRYDDDLAKMLDLEQSHDN